MLASQLDLLRTVAGRFRLGVRRVSDLLNDHGDDRSPASLGVNPQLKMGDRLLPSSGLLP